ncbi:hypothetical protein Droror1_Dr00005694 [Drosera rotundifolia]
MFSDAHVLFLIWLGYTSEYEYVVLLLCVAPLSHFEVNSVFHEDSKKYMEQWLSSLPKNFVELSLNFVGLPQKGKIQNSLSHSPKTRTAGFSVNTGQGSPSEAAAQSKWFKPEIDSPSSIGSIQIEEKAMKDLRRFYSNVKLVRNQS